MFFSSSSIIITIVMVSLLILLLQLLLTKPKGYSLFRTDFLSILIFAICLKLVLPIELWFTISVPSEYVMVWIRDFINYNITSSITVLHLLVMLWIIGIIIQIIRYIKSILYMNSVLHEIKKNALHTHISKYIRNYKGKDYSVYVSTLINTPMVLGFEQSILLPKNSLSDDELQLILEHETTHIQNKDIWIKQFINMLGIVYWWFYPVYVLKKQIDLFLEMRTDTKVTKDMSLADGKSYTSTLLDMQTKLKMNHANYNTSLSTFLINDDNEILKYRVNYLIEGTFTKKTKKTILLIAFMLPVLTNFVIFEPASIDPEIKQSTLSEDDLRSGYLIEHKDGTFSLVLDGQEIKINNPIDKTFESLKVIKE